MSLRRKCMVRRTLVDDHRAFFSIVTATVELQAKSQEPHAPPGTNGERLRRDGNSRTPSADKLGNRAVRRNTALAGISYRGKYVPLQSVVPDQISGMGGRRAPPRVLSYRFHVPPFRPAFLPWNVQR